jgi:hypothetical protein
MRQLPAKYGKSPKDKELSLEALIARAEAADPPVDRLTDKTPKRHLSTLSQFFLFAMDEGHLTVAARSEMVDKHRFRAERAARDQREEWDSEDLQTLFRSPVWTGCHAYYRTEVGTEIIRDAKFWLPLLALYHGARLEEFADLYARDVYCDNGTWAFNLRETEIQPGELARRLKTPGATRAVPIHPEIIRIGFLQYLRAAAPGPDDAVFPTLIRL